MSRSDRIRAEAAAAVEAQEYAQALKDSGRLRWLADDADCPDLMRLAALTEEIGEVARAIHDDDPVSVLAELAQVAGIALAWRVALTEAL